MASANPNPGRLPPVKEEGASTNPEQLPPRSYFKVPDASPDDEVPEVDTDIEKPLPRIDFFVRLAGYSNSPNRNSMFAYVIIMDEQIWEAHQNDMKEMCEDYGVNYNYRRGSVETCGVGTKVVVWTLVGGQGIFVRATVSEVKRERGEPVFICQGWDDIQEYKVDLAKIFKMTPTAAGYRCMKVPLLMEGLHGFFDFPQMPRAFEKAWEECGTIYAVRHARPHPNTEPHGPIKIETFGFVSFLRDSLNDKIGEQFVRLVRLDFLQKFKEEKQIRVKVTHVDHYSHVWLQLPTDEILDRIHMICKQCVAKYHSIAVNDPTITFKDLGEQRYVVELGDGSCLRAVVYDKDNSDESKVVVEFVDFGRIGSVSISDLYDLSYFDPLTSIIDPRCSKSFIHNSKQGKRLDDEKVANMRETVQAFAPHTTTALHTGKIKADGKDMQVYEIRGVVGRNNVDVVNIHGVPYNPRINLRYRHGHPDKPERAADKLAVQMGQMRFK